MTRSEGQLELVGVCRVEQEQRYGQGASPDSWHCRRTSTVPPKTLQLMKYLQHVQPHVLPDRELVMASSETTKSSVMGQAPTPHPTFPEPRHSCRTSSTTPDMHRVGAVPAGSDLGRPMGTEQLPCCDTVHGDLSPPRTFLITALKGVKRLLPTHNWPSSAAVSQASPWQNYSSSKPPREVMVWGSLGLMLIPALPPHTHTHQPHLPMKTSAKIFTTQPSFRENWRNGAVKNCQDQLGLKKTSQRKQRWNG